MCCKIIIQNSGSVKEIIFKKEIVWNLYSEINAKSYTYLGIEISKISKSGRCKTIIIINRRLLRIKRIRVCVRERIRSRRGRRRSRCCSHWTCRTLIRSRRSRSWRWLFRFLRWKSRTRTLGTRRSVKICERIVSKRILRVLNETNITLVFCLLLSWKKISRQFSNLYPNFPINL